MAKEDRSVTLCDRLGSTVARSPNGSGSMRFPIVMLRRRRHARRAISRNSYRAVGRKVACAAGIYFIRSKLAATPEASQTLSGCSRNGGVRTQGNTTPADNRAGARFRSGDRAVDLANHRRSTLRQPRGLLTNNQAVKVDALKSEWREFTTMRGLAMRFRGILRSKNVAKLGVWLTDAHQSGLYAMQRFARTCAGILTP